MIPDVPKHILQDKQNRDYKTEIAEERQRIQKMQKKQANLKKIRDLEHKLEKSENNVEYLLQQNPDIGLPRPETNSPHIRKISKDTLKNSIFNTNDQKSLMTKKTTYNTFQKIGISGVMKPNDKPAEFDDHVIFDFPQISSRVYDESDQEEVKRDDIKIETAKNFKE